MTQPLLFSPLALRGLTLRNRAVLSPMCQYSAHDGMAGDWHFAHLAKFATGGFGLVFCEAMAVVVSTGCAAQGAVELSTECWAAKISASLRVSKTCAAERRADSSAPSFMRMNALVV